MSTDNYGHPDRQLVRKLSVEVRTVSKHKFEEFEMWVNSGNDHFFDCEKQMLALLDYFRAELLPRMIATPTKIVRK